MNAVELSGCALLPTAWYIRNGRYHGYTRLTTMFKPAPWIDSPVSVNSY